MPPSIPRRPAERAWRVKLSGSTHARLEVLLGILSLAAGLLVLAYKFPEKWWTDRRFEMQQGTFAPEAMLVGLDEKYVERYGDGAATPAYLARVVRAALDFEPTAIALDFGLRQADASDPGVDSLVRALAEANSRGVPVVLPTHAASWGGQTRLVRKLPPGARAIPGLAGWESADVQSGLSPALRAFPATERLADDCHILSFPVAAVAAHRRALRTVPRLCDSEGTFPESTTARILGSVGVPATGSIPIYFAGSLQSAVQLSYYSSEDLLSDDSSGLIPASYKHKLLLIAAVWPQAGPEDQVATPFGEQRGGVLHFYSIDTLLRNHRPAPAGTIPSLALALLVFGGTLAAWQRWGLGVLWMNVAGIVVFVAAAFLLFPYTHLLVPIAWPLWAALLATALGFLVYGGENLEVSHNGPGAGHAPSPSSGPTPAPARHDPPPGKPLPGEPGRERGDRHPARSDAQARRLLAVLGVCGGALLMVLAAARRRSRQ